VQLYNLKFHLIIPNGFKTREKEKIEKSHAAAVVLIPLLLLLLLLLMSTVYSPQLVSTLLYNRCVTRNNTTAAALVIISSISLKTKLLMIRYMHYLRKGFTNPMYENLKQ
jgi:hypothetical protein